MIFISKLKIFSKIDEYFKFLHQTAEHCSEITLEYTKCVLKLRTNQDEFF